MRAKINDIVNSNISQNFILVLIIFNAVLMGLMTDKNFMSSYGEIVELLNTICLVIFTVELVVRIFAAGLNFFKDGWNIFDFIIVMISLLPTSGMFSTFRIVRVLRVLRSLRALRVAARLARLRLIIQAIIGSLSSIGWTSLLLGIIFYVFSIVGVTLFAESFPEWFGSIGKSMYTLFQVMTLESWSMGISRPVMEVFPWAFIYFIPFILITSYVVINVVVGVVVNTIGEISDKNKLEEAHGTNHDNIQVEFVQLKKQLKIVEVLLNEVLEEKKQLENEINSQKIAK